MENIYINHFAVIICAFANLALGALWYSPVLFYNAWKNENKIGRQACVSLQQPASQQNRPV